MSVTVEPGPSTAAALAEDATAGTRRRPWAPPAIAAVGGAAALVAEHYSGSLADGVAFLYIVPIAVLAAAYGRRVGLFAAALAFAVFVAWAAAKRPEVTTVGYALRGSVFLVVGGLIGAISDRQRREHSLLDALIEEAPEAIIRSDGSGTIVRANRQAERLFGYRTEELVGQPLSALVPDDRAGEPAYPELIAVHRELTARRKNGTSVAVEAALGPLGERELTTSIFRDVSERRRVEAELARSREELAARAEELERSNAELEQFAYIASHDLSEPLRVVAGFVGLLQRRYGDKLDEEAIRFIDTALAGTDRMQALIDALLAYSRVGSGAVERQSVESQELVTSALEGLKHQMAERDVDVEVDQLPSIDCEPTLAAQLFQNLISNAVKFADGRRPRVRISAEREGGAWRFSVADNGDGIDAEHEEEVFELFRRFHGPEVPGTGIGLAVCKRIVERHGGEIQVDAGPNGGSIFSFTIADAAEPAAG